ncbi:MAG: hypothetical protein O3C57_04635 [Verrucomicrobia bacterium]|nr:hypothetical protein [Verrucomicrobiota bacterium]
MKVFTATDLENYQIDDHILRRLDAAVSGNDANLTSHQWLLDSLPKRMIFDSVYGELLQEATPRQRVLDVGGGCCSLTRVLANRHDYQLLDIMAHAPAEIVHDMERSTDRSFWICDDWHAFKPQGGYDLIIANDLFPNVDQRLSMFLDKFLPICTSLVVTLTYYPKPRFYKVRRVDADEIMFLQAWDERQTKTTLQRYLECVAAPDLDALFGTSESLFPNGRQICQVTFKGHLEHQNPHMGGPS